MKRLRAFTLIELLIVVLIIAILAAIAIPNFLEFQTRAKVSRALSDMRTIRVALEAYCVDEGSYPNSACPLNNHNYQDFCTNNGGIVLPQLTWKWYAQLTSPIAYITNIPHDPFSKEQDPCWYGGPGRSPFHFYTGNAQPYSSGASYSSSMRMMYALFSVGPDQIVNVLIDNTDADAYVLYIEERDNSGGRGWRNAMPYDPTNGTVSAGDIYTFNTTESELIKYFLY